MHTQAWVLLAIVLGLDVVIDHHRQLQLQPHVGTCQHIGLNPPGSVFVQQWVCEDNVGACNVKVVEELMEKHVAFKELAEYLCAF